MPKSRKNLPEPEISVSLTFPRPYSVLLLYPDGLAENYGEETFYAWVKAADPAEAVQKARQQARRANPGSGVKPEDFALLLCIAGHHYGETAGED